MFLVFGIEVPPFRVVVGEPTSGKAYAVAVGILRSVYSFNSKHRLFFQRCPLSLDVALVARVPELRGFLLFRTSSSRLDVLRAGTGISPDVVPVYRVIHIALFGGGVTRVSS